MWKRDRPHHRRGRCLRQALASVAAARDGQGDTVSVADFLPVFFGWRFGTAAAEHQLAAFEAGLRAEAGSDQQLRIFCAVVGLQLDQVDALSNGRRVATEQEIDTVTVMGSALQADTDEGTNEDEAAPLDDVAPVPIHTLAARQAAGARRAATPTMTLA